MSIKYILFFCQWKKARINSCSLQNEYLKYLSLNWDSQRIVFPKTGVRERTFGIVFPFKFEILNFLWKRKQKLKEFIPSRIRSWDESPKPDLGISSASERNPDPIQKRRELLYWVPFNWERLIRFRNVENFFTEFPLIGNGELRTRGEREGSGGGREKKGTTCLLLQTLPSPPSLLPSLENLFYFIFLTFILCRGR